MKITKRSVEALSVPSGESRKIYWDDQLKGFGVAVMASGARSYVFQYRMGGRAAMPQRITIGRHGNPWTADGARQRARDLSEHVRKGQDPKILARTQQEIAQAARLAEESLEFSTYTSTFYDQYVLKKEISRPSEIASLFAQHILPKLKGKQISAVSPADLEKLFNEIGAKSRSTANKAYRWLNIMYNWALRRDDLAKSPLRNIDMPFKEVSRDRVLDDTETALVWTAAESLGYPFGPLIKLLITTGQRRCEVAKMKWSEVNLHSREWTIPSSRTKNGKTHVVPLSDLAIDVLSNILPCDDRKSDFVFTTNGKTSVTGYSRAKKRLDEILRADPRGRTCFAPWRLHDLRRTMATGCQRLGVPIDHTEALLNHTSGRSALVRTYQRYDYAKEKRLVVEAWSSHLTELVNQGDLSMSSPHEHFPAGEGDQLG